MRTFVVSGATGFLGGRLTAMLLAHGEAVLAVVRTAAAAQRLRAQYKACALQPVLAASAALAPALDAACSRVQGDEPAIAGVVHAAVCYGRRGEPDAALHAANVALPLALLDWAQRQRAGGFVLADTVLAPDADRYAASKALGRELLRTQAQHLGLPLVDLRLEHLYGPGDAPERFVPWLAQACRAGGGVVPLGSGRQQREFVHVDDATNALLCVLDALPRLRRGWHATRVSGESTTLRVLAETVHALTASGAALAFGARVQAPHRIDPDAPGDDLLRRLGWMRRIPLAAGLRDTLEEASS